MCIRDRNTTQEADFAALGVDQRAEQLLALLQQNDPRLATGKSAKDPVSYTHLTLMAKTSFSFFSGLM